VLAFLPYEICAIYLPVADLVLNNGCGFEYFEGWNDTSIATQEVMREFIGRLRGFADARDLQSSPLL